MKGIMKRLFVLVVCMACLAPLLAGCNNTKIETQTTAGGGSSTITTSSGQTCINNPDGSQTCYPTSSTTTTANGGTGTGNVRVDNSAQKVF